MGLGLGAYGLGEERGAVLVLSATRIHVNLTTGDVRPPPARARALEYEAPGACGKRLEGAIAISIAPDYPQQTKMPGFTPTHASRCTVRSTSRGCATRDSHPRVPHQRKSLMVRNMARICHRRNPPFVGGSQPIHCTGDRPLPRTAITCMRTQFDSKDTL